jgi:hypothetical protein
MVISRLLSGVLPLTRQKVLRSDPLTGAGCALTKFWGRISELRPGQQQVPEANALVWSCMFGNNSGFPGKSKLRTTFFNVHYRSSCLGPTGSLNAALTQG